MIPCIRNTPGARPRQIHPSSCSAFLLDKRTEWKAEGALLMHSLKEMVTACLFDASGPDVGPGSAQKTLQRDATLSGQ